LFKSRAQGFEIAFKFRNAPPRPPVGPSFIGTDLDDKLREISQYEPLNAVETNYRWKLHSEPDLGVPLAPSAMDPKYYKSTNAVDKKLHADDLNLLEWKGSMGDTAAEELKKSRDNARAAARLALLGKTAGITPDKSKSAKGTSSTSTKKAFSRVLDESMQSWMKKTTYITNDYTRKVHDFKSLAKTKQEIAQNLEIQQQQISQRRSAPAVSKTFEECKQAVVRHPSKKGVTPVAEMPLLPDISRWAQSYTQVVIDKSPGDDIDGLNKAMIANVINSQEMSQPTTCQLFVPRDGLDYQAVQQYDLDIIPLKDGDEPHMNFFIWVDPDAGTASYRPIPSRLNLSVGRPLKNNKFLMQVTRRAATNEEKTSAEEKIANEGMDLDLEQRYGKQSGGGNDIGVAEPAQAAAAEGSDEDF
jgi:Paf1